MCDLSQARILVTRPAHQSENLCAIIAAENGIPIQFPTLEISPILLDCYEVEWLLNHWECDSKCIKNYRGKRRFNARARL